MTPLSGLVAGPATSDSKAAATPAASQAGADFADVLSDVATGQRGTTNRRAAPVSPPAGDSPSTTAAPASPPGPSAPSASAATAADILALARAAASGTAEAKTGGPATAAPAVGPDGKAPGKASPVGGKASAGDGTDPKPPGDKPGAPDLAPAAAAPKAADATPDPAAVVPLLPAVIQPAAAMSTAPAASPGGATPAVVPPPSAAVLASTAASAIPAPAPSATPLASGVTQPTSGATPLVPARDAAAGVASGKAPATPATVVSAASQGGVPTTAQHQDAQAGAGQNPHGGDGQGADQRAAATLLSKVTSDAAAQAPTATSQLIDLLQTIAAAPGTIADAATPASGDTPAVPVADEAGDAATPATGRPGVVTLEFSPPNLGRVTVTLRMSGGALDVHIGVDNKQTLSMLSADKHLLSTALGAAHGTLDLTYVPSATPADAATPSGGRATAGDPRAADDANPGRGGREGARRGDPSPSRVSDHDLSAATAPRRDDGLYL